MKKVFLLFSLCVLSFFMSNAQTNLLKKTGQISKENKSTFLSIDQPLLPFRNAFDRTQTVALSNSLLGNSKLLDSGAILEPNVYQRKAKPKTDNKIVLPFFQRHNEYTREDIMKLPAVNTYDIIKILDTDRLLTQW